MGKFALVGLLILIVFSIFILGVIPDSFGQFRLIFTLIPFILTGMFLWKIL